MAQAITIKVSLDTGDIRQGAQQIERQVKGAVDGAVRQAEAGGRRIGSALTSGIASSLKGAGHALSVGLSLPLTALGVAAIKAAKDLDTTRQQLVALTGSTDAANKKLAELRKLAQESPGVTSRLAQTAFAQLRAVGTIADETINRVIKSVGRLNAVFTIEDVDGFVRNLVQIFNQGFERADVKEALGRVPIFEQILQNAFGTKDPDKLRQMQQAGELTIDQYLTGLSRAIDGDPRFARVQESLAGKFEKARDQILTALAPLGERILDILVPILDRIIPKILALLDAFAKLPPGVQENIVLFGAFAIALGPVLSGVGSLIGLVNSLTAALGTAGLAGSLSRVGALLAGPAGLLLLAGGAGVAAASFDLNQRLDAQFPQRGLRDFNGNPVNRFGNPNPQITQRAGNVPLAISGVDLLTGRPLAPTSPVPAPVAARIGAANRSRRGGGGLTAGGPQPVELPDLFSQQQLDRLADQVNRFFAERLAPVLPTILAGGPEGPTFTPDPLSPDQLRVLEERNRLLDEAGQFRVRDLQLATEEQRIQNLINIGVLSESEGREQLLAVQSQYRDVLIQSLEAQKALTSDPEQIAGLTLQIEQLRTLGIQLTESQRFIRGLGSETETLGDIFERFGQNVSRAFGNIKDVFNGLKNAVKQFFADILGNSLRNLLRGTLGALFGGGAVGGGGGGAAGGGGVGGFFGNLLGGVFSNSGLRTSGTTSAAGGGGGLNFFGGGSSSITGGINTFLTGGFAGGGGAASILGPAGRTAGGGFGGIIPSVIGGLGNLFKGFGFGLPAGSAAGSLAASAPLLGIGLGASLGGSSVLGQILGGVGGGLLGIGLTAAPAGLLGGALGFLAPLFSNPVTAIIGAALIPLAIFAGRAKQRKKDEEQSGIWLTEAITGIQQIKAGVQAGSIPPDQARSIFENQVIATFIQQINTLKTKSVRESRLTNQVRDLRNMFDREVGPVIESAKKAGVVNRNIIPEFHTGGLAANETLAVLQRGEMVLTAAHQNRINSMMPGVFESVGVPNAPNQTGTYHSGGRVSQGVGGDMKVDVTVVMGRQDQTQIFVNGIQTENGKKALARSILRGRLDREI